MSIEECDSAYSRTMRANRAAMRTNAAYIIHAGMSVAKYIKSIKMLIKDDISRRIAIGGVVPHILKTKGALENVEIASQLLLIRRSFVGHNVHGFGLGSTATLHVARLIGLDSVNSSGYRHRAARGVIQLPGTGDREIAPLGSWGGRGLSIAERRQLCNCVCPACRLYGIKGLRAAGVHGFACRASHNLWVLYDELDWLNSHIADGTYGRVFQHRLKNSAYRGIVDMISAIVGRGNGDAASLSLS